MRPSPLSFFAGYNSAAMLVSEFDYHLPQELIAQEPLASREAARMLHLERGAGTVTDRQFSELPDLLRSGDLVVLNNTRVFPARLFARRGGLNSQPLSPRNPASKDFLRGEVEVLLTRQLAENDWEALVRPGRKIGVGERLYFPPPGSLGKREAEAPQEESLRAEVVGRGEYGQRTLRFQPVEDFFGVLERIGHIPLPPYIRRPDRAADRDRYQTVFGSRRGSVAAPTAGLHFTPEILRALKKRGIETAEITLHVGLGTFSPVRVAEVGDHKLHPERFAIPEDAAASINLAIAAGRRVVAVGTTTVRALEFAAMRTPPHARGVIQPQQGEADIFIFPGFHLQVIGAMLTNFHLPKSSLLMLVSAFGGTEFILKAYRHAVEQRYRFYSYGDCMLIE